MMTLSKQRIITYLILLLLIIVDISLSLVVLVHDELMVAESTAILAVPWKNWSVALYGLLFFGSFPLISIIILLNRDDLQQLKMDKPFILIFLFSGLSSLYALPYNCFTGILLISVFSAFVGRKLLFGTAGQKPPQSLILKLSVALVCVLAIYGFINAQKIGQVMYITLVEVIPLATYEEAVYRGVLYKFLKDIKYSETRIFFTQAILFWVTHIHYLLQKPINFWVIIPIVSLTLGYIAMRSKSITPSTIAHVLINMFFRLVSAFVQ